MKIKFFASLAASLLFCLHSAFAFVDFVELEQDGHVVILLGDLHNPEADAFNQAHTEEFLRNLKEIEALSVRLDSDKRKSSRCYFELSPKVAREIRQSKVNQTPLPRIAATFKVLAEDWDETKPRHAGQLIPFEPRPETNAMSSDYTFELVYDLMFKVSQEAQIQGTPLKETRTYTAYREQLFSPPAQESLTRNGFLSVRGYLAHARALYADIKKICENSSEVAQALKKLHDDLKNGYREILYKFGSVNQEELFATTVFNMVDSSDNPVEEANAIHALLHDRFEFLYADAKFLQRILLDRQEFPGSATILVAGLFHTRSIQPQLESIGYKVRSSSMSKLITPGRRDVGKDLSPKLASALTRFHFNQEIQLTEKRFFGGQTAVTAISALGLATLAYWVMQPFFQE